MIRKLYNSGKVRILPVMLAFLFLTGTAYAQMFVSGGTTVKVQEGTVVTDGGYLNLDANSTLNNQGTMYIKGNLTNNNTTDNNLGTGTFEFNGATAQTISGPNVFGTLVINNANGVSLTGSYNNTVSTGLTLASGRLDLGSTLSLLLGPALTSVGGTLNATNMIVATGTGELRKQFATGTSDPAAFIFPVGDNSTTAEYSPVTLNFGSSTFADGNYAGVKLADAVVGSPWVDPQISRYWDLSSTGISSFTCQADFVYVDADLQLGSGAETDIYCTKVSPDPVVTYNQTIAATNTLSAPGLTSFSRFTGVKGGIQISLIAMLEGAYNTTNHNMNTTINGLIPSSQPYSGSPWYYSGTESFTPPVGTSVVDWVLIELRQASTPANATTAFATQAGLLLNNGTIVDQGGSGALRFYNVTVTPGNSIYPVVYHRNHMPTMANNGATLNGDGSFTYNYTTSSSQIYGSGSKFLETGVWGMLAGDGDNDVQIQNSDYVIWANSAGGIGIYNLADYDLDGSIQNSDYVKWSSNAGILGSLP